MCLVKLGLLQRLEYPLHKSYNWKGEGPNEFVTKSTRKIIKDDLQRGKYCLQQSKNVYIQNQSIDTDRNFLQCPAHYNLKNVIPFSQFLKHWIIVLKFLINSSRKQGPAVTDNVQPKNLLYTFGLAQKTALEQKR